MPAHLLDTRTGEPHPLDPGRRFLIGRSQGCDLRVTDGSIARTHADLTARPEGAGVVWVLNDRGSTNGTRLNSEQVGREPVPLRDGDVIRLAEMPPLIFCDDGTKPRPAPPPDPDRPVGTPAEILRDLVEEILARRRSRDAGGYRDAPLVAQARAAGPSGETLAALTAADRLAGGDLAGGFEALLLALDAGLAPGPTAARAAHALIALAPDRAGPVLQRRVTQLLDGALALPWAQLLAASGDDRSMFDLRNHAGRLRDARHPLGRPLLDVLANTPPSPWRGAFREHLHAPPAEPATAEQRASLAARVAHSLRVGPNPGDAALVAEVAAELRATPVDEAEKRAALGRMLDELTHPWRGIA